MRPGSNCLDSIPSELVECLANDTTGRKKFIYDEMGQHVTLARPKRKPQTG